MSNPRKDLHIAILEYGRGKLERGVTYDELRDHLHSNGYEVSDERLAMHMWDCYETVNFTERFQSSIDPLNDDKRDTVKCSLKVESTFRLLEYEELQSANRSSRVATYWAAGALAVSAVFALISIVSSFYFFQIQRGSSAKIEQSQLDKILQLQFDASEVEQSLGEILELQRLQHQKQELDVEIEEPGD